MSPSSRRPVVAFRNVASYQASSCPMRTLGQRLAVWGARLVAWLLGVVLFRWRAKGAEHVEREGPLLLLCNHTSFFDPVWAGYFVGGDVAFMASTNLFRFSTPESSPDTFRETWDLPSIIGIAPLTN